MNSEFNFIITSFHIDDKYKELTVKFNMIDQN